MKKTILVALIILFVIFISGCAQQNIKTITISGIDQKAEISNENPVELVISGINNEVTVLEGTEVVKIILSGDDCIVNLPLGSNPEIDKSGINNQIKYY
jgi:ABC-type Fe3+-hydroxamate transport system substrate-binding protein